MDTYDNSLWRQLWGQLWGQQDAQDGQNPRTAAIAPPGFYAAPAASRESPDAFAAANSGLGDQIRNRLQQYLGGFQAMQPKTAGDLGEMALYSVPGLGQGLSVKDAVTAGSSGDWPGVGIALGGMFGGPLAKTADHAALARAGEMHAAGHSAEDIWHSTGWFQGKDDKWRFEIPDDQSSFNRAGMQPKEYRIAGNSLMADTGSAGATLPHPALYGAYPQFEDLPFVQGRGNFKAQYSPPLRGDDHGSVALNLDWLKAQPEQHSTSLHEMQHAVQHAEDFARGGNADALKGRFDNPALPIYEKAAQSDPELREYLSLKDSPQYQSDMDAHNRIWNEQFKGKYDALDSQITRANFKEIQPQLDAILKEAEAAGAAAAPTMARTDALYASLRARGIPTQKPSAFLSGEEVYPRLAGEVEARNVQTRMNMSPEDRVANPPWTTEDVPRDQQIVRFGSGGPSMSADNSLNKAVAPDAEAAKAGAFDFSNPGVGGTRTAQIGNTEVTYGVGKNGDVELTLLKTPKNLRGQGSGRAAMEQLIQEADANGSRVLLNADPMDKGISKNKLVDFYKSFGFKRNAGNKRDFTTRAEFIREPGE